MGTYGPDYDPELDGERVAKQMETIRDFMLRHEGFLTLSEIEVATGYPPASISAQLRHLRKERFGLHLVEKRRRGDGKAGLWEYRVHPAGTGCAAEQFESVEDVVEMLDGLPRETRKAVFRLYCFDCARKKGDCKCGSQIPLF